MNGELTIHDIRHMTLSQVSTLYGNGSITRETAQDYVDLWNSGPHFTLARVEENYISNFRDRE